MKCCQKFHEKTIYRVSINRHLQGENRGREKEVWEKIPPDWHQQIKTDANPA
jgi:hypothetical protein